MKQLVYVCDICKRETDPDEMLHTESGMDVCARCLAELVDKHFAKMEKILDSATEKKPVKVGKKQPAAKQTFDKGKAQALRNAGWQIKDIAKEMGCCPATIFNNTTKPVQMPAKKNEFIKDDLARLGDLAEA